MDRADKVLIYAREQVRHAWPVNPLSSTVEAYTLEGAHWSLLHTFAGSIKARVPPFDLIDLTLLWPAWCGPSELS